MVGHRDRAEPLRSRGRQQDLDRRGAVAGMVGVHVQVDVDQLAPGEQLPQRLVAALLVASRSQLVVDLLQLRSRPVAVGHEPVVAREVALHQPRGGGQARGARIEATEEALDEAARDERRQEVLAGGVKRAHVQGARVAQRGVGGARRKRLVHVHEVQRHQAEQFLDRARDVDRQRRRAPPRRAGRHVEHLADRDHARLAAIGSLQQRLGLPARRSQRAPRRAHPLLRARRRDDQHAVAVA